MYISTNAKLIGNFVITYTNKIMCTFQLFVIKPIQLYFLYGIETYSIVQTVHVACTLLDSHLQLAVNYNIFIMMMQVIDITHLFTVIMHDHNINIIYNQGKLQQQVYLLMFTLNVIRKRNSYKNKNMDNGHIFQGCHATNEHNFIIFNRNFF